jgi:hypothetical protein
VATRLYQAKVSPLTAQRIMGHSDYRTTAQHYTGGNVEDLRADLNVLSKSLPVN